MTNNKCTILVSGSSGLCGSFISEYLKQKTDKYDVFTTSRQPSNSTNHIIHDLFHPIPFDSFPSEIDCIIHCAGNINQDSTTYSVIDENMKISFNLIQYASKINTRCFINFSSISVYGESDSKCLITEESKNIPSSVYGISKLLVEDLTNCMLSNITRVINLRIGYVLGPQIPSRYIISRFKESIVNGEITKLINPDTTRFSFIDIFDIARICEVFLNNKKSGVYNVISDYAPTVRETFKEITKYFPRNSGLFVEHDDKSKEFSTLFSNEKIKKILSFDFKPYSDSFRDIFGESFNHYGE